MRSPVQRGGQAAPVIAPEEGICLEIFRSADIDKYWRGCRAKKGMEVPC